MQQVVSIYSRMGTKFVYSELLSFWSGILKPREQNGPETGSDPNCKNPVILSIMQHRQNSLECTYISAVSENWFVSWYSAIQAVIHPNCCES
jgi:hypothetical protein